MRSTTPLSLDGCKSASISTPRARHWSTTRYRKGPETTSLSSWLDSAKRSTTNFAARRTAAVSVAIVGGSVQLGLFFFSQSLDLLRVKRVVPCQMLPIRHALDSRLGDVDRLEPFAQFLGV